MLDVAINNGTVVNHTGSQEVCVGLKDGKVVLLSRHELEADVVIDARKHLVFPGLVDPHTHFQPTIGSDTGASILEWTDDFYSGTVSAACGGVTTIVDFAVQEAPEGSLSASISRYHAAAAASAVVDYAFHAGITVPTENTLLEIRELADAGVKQFKLFRTYREWGLHTSLGFMREAFHTIADVGGVAAVHCEQDEILSFLREKYLQAGFGRRLELYSDTRPAVAEEIAIDEVAALAREAGVEVYAVHVSSHLGLSAVRRAKLASKNLSAECGLHYLFFDRSVYEGEDAALYFMTPPFREDYDPSALWTGLEDGTLDWIGTDHSPQMSAVKLRNPTFGPGSDGEVFGIPPGFTGVEEMLPLMFTHGVLSGRFGVERLVELLSYSPAVHLQLSGKGSIEVGKDGDVVVFNPLHSTTLRAKDLRSKSDYTIYEGFEVRGRVEHTFCRGRHVVKDAEFVGSAGSGEFVSA